MRRLLRVSVEATITVTRARTVFSYRLTNTGNAALGEFALAVPAGVALRSPSAPCGWLARYTPVSGQLVWQSTAPATDLAPGESLGGFSIRAAALVGLASYRARHFAADGHTASRVSGTTPAPALSPGKENPAEAQAEMYRLRANRAHIPYPRL